MELKKIFKPDWIKLAIWVLLYFLVFDILFPVFDSQFYSKEPFPLIIWIPAKLAKLVVPYLIACLLVFLYHKFSTK